jgi:hypothetical protein
LRYEIQELGVGGILDQAIALVRDHFRLFLVIMLLVYVPLDLLLQWVTVLDEEAAVQVTARSNLKGILLLAKTLIATPLTNGAIIRAVASTNLQQPITATAALGSARRIFLPILGTMFITGFCIILGFLLIVASLFIFTAAGWVVFYFSCRSKHERFDLAILADQVGADLPIEASATGSV